MMNKITFFLKSLNEKQLLLLLIGMTFGLRLYAVLMAQGIAYDSAGYGFMARDFLKGDFIKGLSYTFHPFYPFLIFLVSPDTTHVEIVGRFISVIFGTLTLIPVFYLAKETLGPKEAIYSGLFYSFHPYLATYSGMFLSEATYWGFLTLAVYFFWVGLKRRRMLGLSTSGAFLAFAYLTRPEGIGYLFVFLIWIIFCGGLTKGWLRKLLFFGSLIPPFLILSIPYMVHIHRETGQWLISKKAVTVQSEFLKGALEKDDPSTTKMIGKQKPAEKSSRILVTLKNVIRFFPFTVYHYLRAYHFALWIFLFFGLMRVRQKRIKEEWFLASFVFFHLFSLSTFTNSTIRYSIPLIPISLFWAGAGVLEIRKYLDKVHVAKSKQWVLFLIALTIATQLPQSLRPERRHRSDQRIVGMWLKENTPQDAVIMSNSPIEAFHAEREFILLPQGITTIDTPGKSYQEIIQFGKQNGVKYILLNKHTSEVNPDFKGSIRSTDLKEFYRFKEEDGNMIIVYEVIY
jgi:hypothetical protein